MSLDFWRHRNSSRQQVCVQPHSTVNVTLPAFDTERRAAAPLPLSAGACYRSISPVLTALDQQTRRTPLLLSIDGTDGRTDGRSTVSDPAPHTMRAVSIMWERSSGLSFSFVSSATSFCGSMSVCPAQLHRDRFIRFRSAQRCAQHPHTRRHADYGKCDVSSNSPRVCG